MSEILLEMKEISKSFPGVQALDRVSLKIKKGSVHALMGENGAGKSTLMKCLFGIYKMDSGEVLLENEHVNIKDTQEALSLGIAMVHQELQSIPERNIAENIFCGRYPMKKRAYLKMIDHKKMMEDTEKLLSEINLKLSPKTKLADLSVSQRQSIEIAKAISCGAKIVIMDEPTSSLSEHEVNALFDMIQRLKEKGTSIIYISHKIEEILKISDEVTIMRDGTYVGSWSSSELTTDMIIQKMVGRELTNRYPQRKSKPQGNILQVENLSSMDPKSFQNISFELRKGEIFGIGGLVGAQRSELMEGIFGMRAISSGKIIYKDNVLKIKRPRDAISKGIALLSEDRRAMGIFGVLSIFDNVTVASLDHHLILKTILNKKSLNEVVHESIEKMSIKAPSSKSLIQNLSGGNQQKVIISRWLANGPDILILDEPTRGIDVGAKYEIYTIMEDLVSQGKSIIMISSEMSELIGMSDRIMVMCEGKNTGLIDAAMATQENIMTLATKYM
ncbi:sugar ABC transporter ATP-binding protein [Traorella massiliensis]|uniref:sugar ABC transporter ATP-binding protein n=1 Tax=Traorella massiliensis TaxID=1903263 RepID=UPI00248DB18E|nr:sugar ABC transporter ATP-binding protein [Traorella massiliensis]